ncbi:MAG: hypothetical protein ACOX6P_04285 [Candidatus Merdivicinus sp.]
MAGVSFSAAGVEGETGDISDPAETGGSSVGSDTMGVSGCPADSGGFI